MGLQEIQVRLRAAIKNSGLKQKDIYMKEDIFPALDTFAKLCALLDVSSDYILGISKEM